MIFKKEKKPNQKRFIIYKNRLGFYYLPINQIENKDKNKHVSKNDSF